MKKFFKFNIAFLYALLFILYAFDVNATATPPVFIRPSIFSTSTDWEAVTGLRLSEYRIRFGRDKTQGNIGMELYFLDGFPCYAQSENVRAWVSPTLGYAVDSDAFIRVTCLVIPETVQLAFRESTRNASQGVTTGMLTCPTERLGSDILVRLPDCDKMESWRDFK